MSQCKQIKQAYESLLEVKGEFDLLYQRNREFDFKDSEFRTNAVKKIPEVTAAIRAFDAFDEVLLKNDRNIQRRLDELQKELKLTIKCEVRGGIVSINAGKLSKEQDNDLCKLLKHERNPISVLELSGHSIDDKSIEQLSFALCQENIKVRDLRLPFNEITEIGIACLAPVLDSAYSRLVSVDLSGNHIGDQGVAQLVHFFKSPYSKTQALSVRGNDITDSGMQSLAEAIADPNCKLEELDISKNEFTQLSSGLINFIYSLLSPDNKISVLDISDCLIGNFGASRFRLVLESQNNKLKSLNLYHCDIGDFAAADLAESFKSPNNKLEYLNLGGTLITEKGRKLIEKAIKKSKRKVRVNFEKFVE